MKNGKFENVAEIDNFFLEKRNIRTSPNSHIRRAGFRFSRLKPCIHNSRAPSLDPRCLPHTAQRRPRGVAPLHQPCLSVSSLPSLDEASGCEQKGYTSSSGSSSPLFRPIPSNSKLPRRPLFNLQHWEPRRSPPYYSVSPQVSAPHPVRIPEFLEFMHFKSLYICSLTLIHGPPPE